MLGWSQGGFPLASHAASRSLTFDTCTTSTYFLLLPPEPYGALVCWLQRLPDLARVVANSILRATQLHQSPESACSHARAPEAACLGLASMPVRGGSWVSGPCPFNFLLRDRATFSGLLSNGMPHRYERKRLGGEDRVVVLRGPRLREQLPITNIEYGDMLVP